MTPAKPSDGTTVATEFAVPLALIGIVLMMVLPLPGYLIDVMLALSLAASIGVFLIGLFMESALEFSAFPAVILVATLLRLSLNVATTRMILLKGHEGHGAAGRRPYRAWLACCEPRRTPMCAARRSARWEKCETPRR